MQPSGYNRHGSRFAAFEGETRHADSRLDPRGPRDPQGIHAAIWSEIDDDGFQLPPDKPLTLAGYSAGDVKRAFIEPVAVGDELPPMPLFLEPDYYVPVPLEATYRAAFDAVPKRWRDELGLSSAD